MKMCVLECIDKIHTTNLGIERLRKNLQLSQTEDVLYFCKNIILSPNAQFERKGKNWYVKLNGCVLTINASSYTIITGKKI